MVVVPARSLVACFPVDFPAVEPVDEMGDYITDSRNLIAAPLCT